MATKEKLNIELEVETLQELEYSLNTLAGKIRWSLDNTRVRDPVALNARLSLVEHAAKVIHDALGKRALDKTKPVRSRPELKAVK